MPPDVQKRIFEPFFTTKETGRGTGLGLAVTYGLVQQCHGTIDVASEPGAGTTFTITLPIHEIDAPSITQIKTETDGGIPSGLTIMLAEDEDDLREPLKQILEQWGLTVLTAMHGNDALDQQDSHDGPIHLLLSDIQMPGLFGDELAKLWRDIRPETKIILMSGFAKGHDPHAGIANAFLPKPINFDVLKKTVQDVLNAPIMGEQNGG
jgi:two-component system cell cycle sensor histidine kinase/response regulator CckA